ncbi:helicase-related protein [Akkermansiaceae bacterium]|nr:helicase-related protein [Akkermansiaceae bacterium]MDB4500634.1 helicase-related protein [Akkermansiaceae bacterium]
MASCLQSIYEVFEHQKTDLLMHLLTRDEEINNAIIFVRGKNDLHALATIIRNEGIATDTISGSKKLELRDRALKNLQNGDIRILVATEAMLREADLTGLHRVIHFDFHELDPDYLKRVETCTEEVTTLVTQKDQKHLKALQELVGSALKEKQAEEFPYADQQANMKRPGLKGSGPNKTGSKPLQHKKPKLKDKGPRRKTGRTRKK